MIARNECREKRKVFSSTIADVNRLGATVEHPLGALDLLEPIGLFGLLPRAIADPGLKSSKTERLASLVGRDDEGEVTAEAMVGSVAESLPFAIPSIREFGGV